jgi:energy-coupling factor transporter ATP-binding protein EcfA2
LTTVSLLSSRQPYPGLRPFEEGDQDYFFGRDAQIQGVKKKLDTSRLVAIVGRSGCGKSSLVRAGLIPLLAKEQDSDNHPVWRVAMFRPQGRPIAELARELLKLTPGESALAGDTRQMHRDRLDAMLRRSSQGLVEAAGELGIPRSGRLLIVVDQFEEIFRFEEARGSDADEATAFVRLLMEAIAAEETTIHVILTMRLDFLGDCARFPRLPEAISDGQFLVPNLSRAERRAAIEQPAKKCGKLIRPEVTQRLLNEIGEDPDQLPVLQHVLMRMWQQAGDRPEITLKDYDDTGGVQGAISRHANQVYDALATDVHREIAERLFKAISERDRRGRSIRRATRLAEISAIVTGDGDANAPAAARVPTLIDVIEAFRAPDCCFLMPAVGEELSADKLIDISHESLLRGWSKMAGKTGNDGWIAEEERDGRIYRSLLDAAENGSRLSSTVARQRQQWWKEAHPNPAWAERYGDRFSTVDAFVKSSALQATFLLLALPAFGALLLIAGLVFGAYRYNDTLREQAAKVEQDKLTDDYNKLTTQYRENLRRLDLAQDKIRQQEAQLAQRSQDLDRTIRQAQSAVPVGDQKVQQDLNKLLQNTGVTDIDTETQRPGPANSGGSPALSAYNGFMWIGSAQGGNLTTLTSAPVLTTAMKPGDQYLTALDIYLRQGPPTRDNYTQQATVGILPQGTRIQILAIAPPFDRPTGQQYWAQIKVVSLALSTVYFQFAGGSRDQAQLISKALQDKGYKIPGEERTSAAAGEHVVRYFYNGQKTIAGQLATDTNDALKRLGISSPPVTIESGGNATKSNPDGKLELWLEIPLK